MTSTPPRNPGRAGPWPIVALLAGAMLIADLLLLHGRGRTPASPPASPRVESRAESGRSVAARWRPLPVESFPAEVQDLALAPGGALTTDGARATYHPAGAPARPLESPVPIPRVFSAGGRLFAQGRNNGAPLLIALVGGEALVVPVPCPLSTLAGRGELFVGGCEGGEALAASRDGAKTFNLLPLALPDPGAPSGAEVSRAIDAVAVDADGTIAVAVTQRWIGSAAGEPLVWTLGHVGVRDAGRFRFASVPGLARVAGLGLAGGELALAGLEFAADGPDVGLLRPRLWRGTLSGALVAAGAPGPDCGAGLETTARGALLGPREAAFLCGGRVSVTLDGAQSWLPAGELDGDATALWGGDMRLVVRAGRKLFESGYALRAESGATAVRMPEASPKPKAVSGMGLRLTGGELREPAPDAGLLEAAAPAGPDAGAPDAGVP